MRINGAQSETELLNLIARWAGFPEKTRRQLPAIELLALASGMELREFVKKHSTLPYRRTITSYKPNIEHGCPENKDMLFISGMRLARKGAYFCKSCIDSDHLNNGMAYWRRDQQLPGVMICTIHDESLHHIDSDSGFIFSPYKFIKSSKIVSKELAKLAINNNTIIRFLSIGRALMSNSGPIAPAIAKLALRRRISDLGLRTHCGNSGSALVSDYILQAYPHMWLESIIPGLTKKRQNTVFHQIDGISNFSKSSSSSAAYLLVVAAIFFSAEEALQTLKSGTLAPVRHSAKRRNDIYLDLRSRYIQAKGKHNLIYSDHLPEKSLMLTFVKTLGFPDLADNDQSSTFIAMRSFFSEGKSLVESVRISQVPTEKIEDLIRQVGIHINLVLREIERG